MGSVLEVTVGYGNLRAVRGHPFLPGLVFHKAPDCAPGEAWVNVSHVRSGLAVVVHADPGVMPQVKEILSRVSWLSLPDEFVESEPHKAVYKEVVELTKKARSLKQEKRLAKQLNGKRQPASGARWGARRDVLLPRFLLEAKTTKATSFSLDLRDLAHLKRQAFAIGKTPAYVIQLEDKEELVVLPFHELTEDDVKGAPVKELTMYGKDSVTIDATMAYKACVECLIHILETSHGRYVLLSYERFLHIAKKGVDDAD